MNLCHRSWNICYLGNLELSPELCPDILKFSPNFFKNSLVLRRSTLGLHRGLSCIDSTSVRAHWTLFVARRAFTEARQVSPGFARVSRPWQEFIRTLSGLQGLPPTGIGIRQTFVRTLPRLLVLCRRLECR